MLPHWQAHNKGHGAEIETWAKAARTDGAERVAALLDKAAANMAATDKILQEAVAEIGAPATQDAVVHHHSHHHHDKHDSHGAHT